MSRLTGLLIYSLRCVSDKLLIQEDPALYFFINQGCLTVDNMDDKEEMQIVDVRLILFLHLYFCLCVCITYLILTSHTVYKKIHLLYI